MDELETIDRVCNSGMVLKHRRLRAYYEFRDRSEPSERLEHTHGPSRVLIGVADRPAERSIAAGATHQRRRIQAPRAPTAAAVRIRNRAAAAAADTARRQPAVSDAPPNPAAASGYVDTPRQQPAAGDIPQRTPAPSMPPEVARERFFAMIRRSDDVGRRSAASVRLLKWTCGRCRRFLFRWPESGAPDRCPSCRSHDMTSSPWTGRAA